MKWCVRGSLVAGGGGDGGGGGVGGVGGVTPYLMPFDLDPWLRSIALSRPSSLWIKLLDRLRSAEAGTRGMVNHTCI